jgi:hypothetical protein
MARICDGCAGTEREHAKVSEKTCRCLKCGDIRPEMEVATGCHGDHPTEVHTKMDGTFAPICCYGKVIACDGPSLDDGIAAARKASVAGGIFVNAGAWECKPMSYVPPDDPSVLPGGHPLPAPNPAADKVMLIPRDKASRMGEPEKRRLQMQLERPDGPRVLILPEPMDLYQRVGGRWEKVGEPIASKSNADGFKDVWFNGGPMGGHAVRLMSGVGEFWPGPGGKYVPSGVTSCAAGEPERWDYVPTASARAGEVVAMRNAPGLRWSSSHEELRAAFEDLSGFKREPGSLAGQNTWGPLALPEVNVEALTENQRAVLRQAVADFKRGCGTMNLAELEQLDQYRARLDEADKAECESYFAAAFDRVLGLGPRPPTTQAMADDGKVMPNLVEELMAESFAWAEDYVKDAEKPPEPEESEGDAMERFFFGGKA